MFFIQFLIAFVHDFASQKPPNMEPEIKKQIRNCKDLFGDSDAPTQYQKIAIVATPCSPSTSDDAWDAIS